MAVLDNVHIEFKCPKCEFTLMLRGRELRRGETVICRGCKSNVKLVDTNKGMQVVDRLLKGLFE